MSKTLAQQLDEAGHIHTDKYKVLVPSYIEAGINPYFSIRPYQQEAIGRFVYYFENETQRPKPLQLLYHMATGSGKTLVMAGLLLYLYEQGYRNFLFFVNSTNIIDKTRDNFLNIASTKHLFAQSISIGRRLVKINEISNFEGADKDSINIVFSTIQGLHTQLNNPSENSLTYYDFEAEKIVLISDEAHHINAATKKGRTTIEDDTLISWEHTVDRIFKAHGENILLEFTATAKLTSPEIAKKYNNLILYDYPLRTFRNEGYSKEVNVLQTDADPFERALQAIILSHYRQKLFEQHGQNIKPVILFKSKTIKESLDFRDAYIDSLHDLTITDLQRLKQLTSSSIIGNAFRYFAQQNLALDNLLLELKAAFSPARLLTVNSKEESEQQQLAVNSLEDEGNIYRIIFAVDKLNEGWDVLNLFDIVRLYDTRDAKAGKPGKTTVSEAQLIGRGARYCPFKITKDQSLTQRKYDDDLNHELRICETLYYHSAYNPQYIQELNTALIAIGIKPDTNEKTTGKTKIAKLVLQAERTMNGLPGSIINHTFQVRLYTGNAVESTSFDSSAIEVKPMTGKAVYKLNDFSIPIIRKALNKSSFYRFSHLQQLFPALHSMSEFIESSKYLDNITLTVNTANELSDVEKLNAAIQVLSAIEKMIKAN